MLRTSPAPRWLIATETFALSLGFDREFAQIGCRPRRVQDRRTTVVRLDIHRERLRLEKVGVELPSEARLEQGLEPFEVERRMRAGAAVQRGVNTSTTKGTMDTRVLNARVGRVNDLSN